MQHTLHWNVAGNGWEWAGHWEKEDNSAKWGREWQGGPTLVSEEAGPPSGCAATELGLCLWFSVVFSCFQFY